LPFLNVFSASWVVRIPFAKMSEDKMAERTECDEVGGFKFETGVCCERNDVMNMEPAFAFTDLTTRLFQEVFFTDSSPFPCPRYTECVYRSFEKVK
jgi:hypothetical protein